MPPKKPHKWAFFVLIPLVGLFLFLFFSQLILNRPVFQKWILESINKSLSINLTWDRLKFNGLTGHFEGKNLTLILPKSQSAIRLKNFRLGLDPVRILFKRIHLLHLEADSLAISITAPPNTENTKKEIPKSFYRFINRVTVDHAEIRQIVVDTPNGAHFQLGRFTLRSHLAFLLLKRTTGFEFIDFVYLSPRADFFLDELKGDGSLNFSLDPELDVYLPEWNGTLKWQNFLFGLNKKANPSNASPAWDSSLDSIIGKYYATGIPDNRTFGFSDSGKIDVKFQSNDIELKSAVLNSFGGVFSLQGNWNRHSGDFRLALENPVPIRMSLLPLGKAQIRQVFENLAFTLSAKGKLKDNLHGNINGNFKLEATGNHVSPIQSPLTISGILSFKDGLIGVKDIKGIFDAGQVNGKGEINLEKKTVLTSFKGKEFDAQTVVHFFSKIDIPGKTDFEGSIQGALNNPVFDISLSSPSVGYEALTLGSFKGHLSLRDKRLSITGNTLLAGAGDNASGTGSLDLKIDNVFNSATQNIDLKTEFKNLPAGPLLHSEVIKGKVNGRIHINGRSQKLEGKGHLEAADIEWYHLLIAKMAADLTIHNKDLTIHPLQILFDPDKAPISISKPFIFDFEPGGYRFSGFLLPTLAMEGKHEYADPDFIIFKLKSDKTPLDFLSSKLWVGMDYFSISFTAEGKYRIKSPKDSEVHIALTAFDFKGEEKNMSLGGKTLLDYQEEKIIFHHTVIHAGKGKVTLDGPLAFTDGSKLSLKGTLDFYQLAGLAEWLVDGDGVADIDVVMTGAPAAPLFTGKIGLKDVSLNLRGMTHELNNSNGTLRFNGHRFQFDRFQTYYDDAPLFLDGWVEWIPPKIMAANLIIKGREIPLSSPESWLALADTDLTIKGSGGSLRMDGNLQIVEGIYHKDYNVTQFILKPVGVVNREEEDSLKKMFGDMSLNLKVRSAGDFEIRNNLAEIVLKGDLIVRGNFNTPQITGTINVLEGDIHAMGINFEEASGFITFNNPRGFNEVKPYLEFSASKAIQEYEVYAKIKGYTDNLGLSLESIPSLHHNDIVSLIAYGVTPDELSNAKRNLFSTNAIASQVVSILQRPLSKAAHLDIVRLESDDPTDINQISRFAIGKQLSGRFSLAFTTDLSVEQAEKGVTAEYLIFDNILLKGVKDTSSRYRFDLTLRFESY